MNTLVKKKIIVGLSGGVDSSVTALLLKQQGHDVTGLFMKNWHTHLPNGQCMWEQDVEDAMHICEQLDIPMNTIDFSHDYWQRVFTQFIEQYKNGRTPNPDILCNEKIKFSAFLQHATENLGAQKIATGHYACITEKDGQYRLEKGLDSTKDQSYFLCRLNQKQLSMSCFPIGKLHKHVVRARAKAASLHTHNKKDSTGICFIGKQPFKTFLSKYLPKKYGDIQTPEGKTIGQHDGVFYYTIGQRQGLNIGGIKDAKNLPWYVYGKDLKNNILQVVQDTDHVLLYSQKITTLSIHWINQLTPDTPFRCTAKIRYRQKDQKCTIEHIIDNHCHVTFDAPQRAVTPGQYIVFYDQNICLGGGEIETAH